MTPSVPLALVGLLLLSLVSSQTINYSVEDLTNRNADFAAQLYRSVSSRTDDNVFLSVFTLSTALSALLCTANGPTQDQLLQGLGLSRSMLVSDLFQALRSAVLQGSIVMNLQQGVAILPSSSFQVSSTYLDLVQTKFGGNAQSLAYTSPQETVDTINRWAQDQTGDRIQELVTNLDSQTQLLLATAASYQSTYLLPSFNSSLTQDERFYVDRYHVVMVPMMFRADKYFLAYDRLLKVGVLKLPMADGTAMLVLLPDEDVDISTIEEEVTGEKIRAWIRQLKKTKLEVQLPRFLLERSYSLRNVLQTLSITQVFQDDADIINMGGDKGPKLTQVYHKSVVSVDESSDDITAGGGTNTFSTLPPRLTINRPFIFIVYHQATGSVLCMGRVIDPTKK
uniref:Serpin peptidase inhibitor, clade A (alpha-1 antiproteinase, antitrypsin), member 10a n=1 Tax=Sparus aurata TaxID=8175 RepID=A0A671VVZ4_SPAAU